MKLQKKRFTMQLKNQKINENLVNAQQARRVLDRLVGFELSPLYGKKLKEDFQQDVYNQLRFA